MEEKLTSINLPHLRQRQPDLIPIQHLVLPLQRRPLKVHRHKLLLILQLPLHLDETRELGVARPQLLELGQGPQAFEVLDGVGGDVDDAEVDVGFEAEQRGYGVVADVEFFEGGEGFEAREGGQAVGLDGEDFEVGQGGEVFEFGDFVLAKPEFLEGGQGVEVFDFLDLGETLLVGFFWGGEERV